MMDSDSINHLNDSFCEFDSICKSLSERILYPEKLTSLADLEYYFKSLIRYYYCARRNISGDLSEQLETQIQGDIDNINNSDIFKNLFDKMAIDGNRDLEEEQLIRSTIKSKIISLKPNIIKQFKNVVIRE